MCHDTTQRPGIGFFEGFAGTVNGSLFKAPLWVDLDKKPGYTSQREAAADGWTLKWFKSYINPVNFVWGCNIVWFVITVGVYLAFPYDFESHDAKTLSWGLLQQRVLIHLGVTHAFFGFWTLCCYGLKLTSRRFSEDELGPSKSRMVHNLHYATLGAIQSGIWDAFFVHIYATGRRGYVSDARIASLSWEALLLPLCVLAGTWWRDLQFFLAHKLIHFSFMYRYVHALHHRNVVIEPYAGLTMHPVEHLYYYGCAGVAVYFNVSPFIPLWILLHALLAPAASHSGFEDIWQSDQFHNLHHQKFECNYGVGGVPLDIAGGTFREKLGKSECYKGAWAGRDDDVAITKKTDGDKTPAKPFLRGSLTLVGALYATPEQAIYDLLSCVCFPLLVVLAFVDRHSEVFSDIGLPWHVPDPTGIVGTVQIDSLKFAAALLTYGPLLVGWLLALRGGRSWRWPFHKESFVFTIVPFLALSNVVCLVPVYTTVLWALEGHYGINVA